MNTNVLQKNDILKTFISEDFKEFFYKSIEENRNEDGTCVDVTLDIIYKDLIIYADVVVYYNYYKDPYFNGYSAPDETGYYFDSAEINNLHICYLDDDTNILNDIERLAIEKYLSK